MIDCFSHVAVCIKSIMNLSCTLKDKSKLSPGTSYFFTESMKKFSQPKSLLMWKMYTAKNLLKGIQHRVL